MDKHTATEEDGGPAFRSIPHAMWFVICSVSTVGYGDVSPNSDLAKSGASMLILCGVCYMAMPLAIVGNTFSDIWANRDKILIAEKAKVKFAEGGFNKEDIQELFAMTDTDGSGQLSRKEFVQLIDAFGLGFTRAQIKKLFKSIDEDGTGSVNFEEFGDFLFPDIEIEDEGPASSSAASTDLTKTPSPAAMWAQSGSQPTISSPPGSPQSVGNVDPMMKLQAGVISKMSPGAAKKTDLTKTVGELYTTVEHLRQNMHLRFEEITKHLKLKEQQRTARTDS